MLKIKEIFGATIEGEGLFTGTKAIFVRLSGCNIWNGKPETKEKSACPYCDTDFVGGEDLTADEVVSEVLKIAKYDSVGLINITGGEPLLQDIDKLCEKLCNKGYKVNIETNGTKPLSEKLRALKMFNRLFITCSPKVKNIKIDHYDIDCLKILYPHKTIKAEDFDYIKCSKYLQPVELDGKINYDECLKKLYGLSSEWKLSVQLHKMIGVE